MVYVVAHTRLNLPNRRCKLDLGNAITGLLEDHFNTDDLVDLIDRLPLASPTRNPIRAETEKLCYSLKRLPQRGRNSNHGLKGMIFK